MIFTIDPNSPKPVYQQIINQVKYAVASGRVRDGDRLGSIRDVAVQIRVNRNTIARAYMELEREGVIRSKPGQGSFIRGEGLDIGKANAKRIVGALLDEILAQAHQFQLSEEEVETLLKERLSEIKLKRE